MAFLTKRLMRKKAAELAAKLDEVEREYTGLSKALGELWEVKSKLRTLEGRLAVRASNGADSDPEAMRKLSRDVFDLYVACDDITNELVARRASACDYATQILVELESLT
jgi:hypothetical protein